MNKIYIAYMIKVIIVCCRLGTWECSAFSYWW